MRRGTGRWTRWLAGGVVVVLGAAAVGGILVTRSVGSSAAQGPNPATAVHAYIEAWKAGDLRTMYSLISRQARRTTSLAGFERAYGNASSVATLHALRTVGRMRVGPHAATFTMVAGTRLFGHVTEPVRLPLVRTPTAYRVAWTPSLTFPGLLPGEKLRRTAHAPLKRGRILARGGEVLAEGPAKHRVYPQGAAFAVVTGYTDAPAPQQVHLRRMYGWPAGWPLGQGGLEKSLDRVLGGSPRVKLLAASANGKRVLAVHAGRAPHDVTTTLQVSLQQAATDALGSRYGGVVVLSPRTGAVEADAGVGMDALQPPGSSFKTVTASAALTAGVAGLDSSYAYARFVVLDGWKLHNFHYEDCGGSLVLAFAVSCNSVFAPLADQVGSKRLVKMAGAYGFNHTPSIAYPVPPSVTPTAGAMDSDLSLGVAGIGQGGVDASPLQMASVAQTIGSGGVQHPPHIVYTPTSANDSQPGRRVISPTVAADVRTMMEAVVTEGTGTSAAISGVTVAGKTGTAEVGTRPSDAWFIAFAPADNPTVAVAVLVVNGGVGGAVAAPIARQVLEAALGL
ncbi:MAG: penicillin-binding transpeptidase domain-containing protein [Gaiellales bacterium]